MAWSSGNYRGVKWGAIGIAVALALATLANSLAIVPTGYTGVRSVCGQIREQPAPQGWLWKIPFAEQIHLVNNRQQTKSYGGQTWGESSDKIQVYAEGVNVTLQIAPERSVWLCANVSGGVDNLVTAVDVASAVKSAMVQFSAEEVTVRSNIEPLVQQMLNNILADKYGKDTVSILAVRIEQMDFEQAYNDAITAKALAAKKQEQQAIENETNVAKAEAEKQVTITNAQASAEARLIQVQTEAEANRLINESTTDVVLQNKFYNVWNGQLPQVMGEGTVITNVAQ